MLKFSSDQVKSVADIVASRIPLQWQPLDPSYSRLCFTEKCSFLLDVSYSINISYRVVQHYSYKTFAQPKFSNANVLVSSVWCGQMTRKNHWKRFDSKSENGYWGLLCFFQECKLLPFGEHIGQLPNRQVSRLHHIVTISGSLDSLECVDSVSILKRKLFLM